MKNEITPEILRQLLDYNPETGALTWRERDVSWFKAERDCKRWNSRYADKPAFTADDGVGYKQGSIFDRMYRAHRVIWALHSGTWPEEQIDHINGDPADNRLVNLRVVTQQENLRNQKRRNDNTSGVCGVSWDKPNQKWRATINIGGKPKHLGLFVEKTEAIAVRAEAEREYGYHKNHGRTS